MHMAAQGGHLEVIKYLAQNSEHRVHEKGANSYTPLHWAAQKGHCELACYLIEEVKMDPLVRDKVCAWGAWLYTERRERCNPYCMSLVTTFSDPCIYMYLQAVHASDVD